MGPRFEVRIIAHSGGSAGFSSSNHAGHRSRVCLVACIFPLKAHPVLEIPWAASRVGSASTPEPGLPAGTMPDDGSVDEELAPSASSKFYLNNAPYTARIKRMMQSDEDVGRVAKATPILICECGNQVAGALGQQGGCLPRQPWSLRPVPLGRM